ncbi:sensor domain-containing diguanylate cyclase [Paraburkholderia sp. CNPSo 3281]|uniref:sensor domain-containing diguanylate cyclase n=1 Tax=Paraburkholderia sp. CNPSo 3281 TaxID=2940933 RepID=UPI0020B88603|nr:sensor domain-containing diguanylate cyclase [Paraburkholderia sp. CNPSo 3281]MCP3715492.1 sensor domain-containing diguanylate cyclase [Paraburkholderia sp. CNPSo 3281]
MWRGRLEPQAIIWGGIFIALVMVFLCATVLYEGRLDAMERARETSRNLALIAERDIERNFELYALSLQAVVDGMRDPDVLALPPHMRRQVLFDRAATAKYLGAMLVLDASGNIVIDSNGDIPRQGNFADRRYFTVQRDNPDVGLYISDPFRSRLRNGSPSIALTRRLSHPDGSFAGIVLIAVNLEYFHTLFAGLSLGPHGSVALIGRDGVMVMRQPYDLRTIGRNISNASTFHHFRSAPEGSFSDTASIDGVRRLYLFRNFPDLPLIIMVAEAERDIFAGWRQRALTIGSLMVAFGLGFIALAFLLGAQLRRRMRAESELQMLARTDGLTGLNNRRTLGEILDQEWRRARRTRSMFSLLFVDIDRFKAYNDAYGHQAGDDALAAVARCIGENIRRPADSAARYGGEEFVVVLPDTPPAGAELIAEQIREAISDLAIEHAGSEYGRVTASIGTACWMPEQDSDVSAVIRAADEALYTAKATGRNKVSTFSSA